MADLTREQSVAYAHHMDFSGRLELLYEVLKDWKAGCGPAENGDEHLVPGLENKIKGIVKQMVELELDLTNLEKWAEDPSSL